LDLNEAEWVELALFLRDTVDHPQYKVFDALMKHRFAELSIQAIQNKQENRFDRGLLSGRIDQHNEFQDIIDNILPSTDQVDKEL